MKRLIVDYKKLNKEILDLLVKEYPMGFADEDIIEFKNASGELIEAVEVRSEDTVYLVKIGNKLTEALRDYEEETDYSDDDADFPEVEEGEEEDLD